MLGIGGISQGPNGKIFSELMFPNLMVYSKQCAIDEVDVEVFGGHCETIFVVQCLSLFLLCVSADPDTDLYPWPGLQPDALYREVYRNSGSIVVELLSAPAVDSRGAGIM